MAVRYLNDDELTHHGVKGQRWGVRRYQNPDGTLTEKGKNKLLDENGQFNKKGNKYVNKIKKRATKEMTNAYFLGDLDRLNNTIESVNHALRHLTGQRVSSLKMWESDPRVIKAVEFSMDYPIVIDKDRNRRAIEK